MKGIELNMGELFKKFLESKEENTVEIPVGVVSDELKAKFKAWRRDKQYLEDELELETDIQAKQIRRFLIEKFEDRKDEIELRKKELWEEIYKELAIDKAEEDTFSINALTGEISKEIKKTDLFGNKSHGIQ